MGKEQSRAELFEPYRKLAVEFVEHGDEGLLYEASLLAREAFQAQLGPQDLVQIHATVLDSLLSKHASEDVAKLVARSSSLLLEMMVVYAQAYQQARDMLATLEENYQTLEQTRHDLERSQRDLRDKTAQLVQTGKMTALGELTAGLVHEVNQPLNAINIIVQDMRRDLRRERLDPASIGPSLGDVAEQVTRIADIVGHLRLFTRNVEAAAPERLDIRIPIEGVFKILGEQLRIRGVNVVKELAEGLEVMGDAVRLEQVFMNLVINARDALEQRSGGAPKRLVLRTYAKSTPEGPFVVCEVADNGSGIPDELREKIFELFFTTKEVGKGTGLGLGISLQIVREHLGHLELDTTEGGGATFRVLLPAAPPLDVQRR